MSVSSFKSISAVIFLCLFSIGCKKKKIQPEIVEPSEIEIKEVSNKIVYGMDCGMYEREVTGAILHSFISTSDNGYIFCGKLISSVGQEYVYALKTDCFGSKEWETTLNNTTNAEALFVQEVIGNDFILFTKRLVNSDIYQLGASAINSSGKELWSKKYSSEARLDFRTTHTLLNEEKIVALISDYSPNSFRESILKIDNQGNNLLEKEIRFDGQLHYVIPENTGSYLAVGQKNGTPTIIKLDATGDSLWTKSFPFQGSAAGFRLALTQNNDILICGVSLNNQFSLNRTLFMIRITSNGNAIWTKLYDSEGYFNFEDVTIADDGHIFTSTNKVENEDTLSFLVKINESNGSVIWSRNMGSKIAHAIVSTSDNGAIYISKQTGNSGSIRKTNSEGF